MKAVVALTLMMGSALASAAQSGAPMVRSGETRQLTPHVWVIEDKETTPGLPNIGIVVGRTGTLVIDTGMGPRNGATVLAEANKLAPGRRLYLVTTHVHPEHDLGASAFPASTKMIRSRDEERDIARNGMTTANAFIARNETNRELLQGAAFRKADIEFDTAYELDLGGVAVRILAMGPDHTLGDTAIFVPADRVLFSGDIAMRGLPSFNAKDSSLNHWLLSLQQMQAMHPAVVVPSHGPVGDAGYITRYQSLLTTIRDRASAGKKQGKTLAEVTASVTAELKLSDADASRLRNAILVAYNEAP